MKIKEMLNDEAARQLENLKGIPLGSQEMGAAIEDLTKVTRAIVDLEKIEIENDKLNNERIERDYKDFERGLKEAQFEDQKKDRWINLGVTAAKIVLPLLGYALLMERMIEFEENGAVSSNAFRNLAHCFKPTMK